MISPAIGSTARLDDAVRLREVLEAIPSESEGQGSWWGTEDGRWLLERVAARIGAPLSLSFSRRYGAAVEAEDVAHTALLVLSRDQSRSSIAGAHDQWAYLYQVLKHELIATLGAIGSGDTDFDHVAEDAVVEPDWDRVTVGDAVNRTLEFLAELTPEPVRQNLRFAVGYFADNGDSRLSHLHTTSARDSSLTSLGLTREQILALANIVLGARPNHGATSLLGGFLRDAQWDPRTSAEHVRALEKYQSRMRKATPQSERPTTAVTL